MSLELSEEERFGTENYGNNESNKGSLLVKENDEKERPWKYKIIALLCVLSLALGSHYSAHTLDALKSVIKKELDISNSKYGVIQSSVSLVNTILPILGGIFLDTFGTLVGSVLATSLIAMGNILVALSTDLRSFAVMVIGRILYGIGSGTIVIVQVTILSHWFKGKGLAIAVGIQIAASRLFGFLANITVIPITKLTGSYKWAFWFAAFLCIFSMLTNLAYVLLMKILNEKIKTQELLKLKQKKRFDPKKLLIFPAIYWIIVSLEFVLGSVWTSFLTINTELVKIRWNHTDEIAAYNSNISQLFPIFISPFLGYFLDRFGNRSLTLVVSAVFLVISMCLLGFTLAFTPIIGMVFFSLSLSLGPVASLSSIPILLPLDYVGTAIGIVKSSSNIGSTIYDIVVGLLQDLDKGKYDMVMIFYLISSIIAVIVTIGLFFVSKNWCDGVMDMKESKRNSYYEEKPVRLEKKRGVMNYLFVGGIIYILLASLMK
ncbi:14922_t:CDS:2 [Funneliformis mosseae]|uniref:Lysosomal dipeptide transporter MFSD1 n=1 Tax=Funneliformis mosseae TaxID=27381 RepID=A0A9N8YUB6_FUNMO|nr:14922_t:CDS:2 [Funneliformis mosseae]